MTYRILVIAPSWIGDCVMTQPLLARLKQRQDHTIIDVYAANWSKAVFSRMPEVNNIITNPFGHGDVKLRARFREGRALSKNHYQEVVVLPGSLKSALVPFSVASNVAQAFWANHVAAYSTTSTNWMKWLCR